MRCSSKSINKCAILKCTYMMTSSKGNLFPRYWTFVMRIHESPVDSIHKGQWRGALMFSLIWGWTKVRQIIETPVIWDAGDLRRRRAHFDVIIMHVHTHIKPNTSPASYKQTLEQTFCSSVICICIYMYIYIYKPKSETNIFCPLW